VNIVQRILRADESRRTRFHTSRGDLCLHPFDIYLAAKSTLARHLQCSLPDLPWITFPAIRHIQDLLRDRRVFEYGSGSSTKWYARYCSQVYSVENDEKWFHIIENEINECRNVEIIFAKSDEESIGCIETVGGHFDAIVIDSQPTAPALPNAALAADLHRVECLKRAMLRAAPDCLSECPCRC
jgi:hypothetical protein